MRNYLLNMVIINVCLINYTLMMSNNVSASPLLLSENNTDCLKEKDTIGKVEKVKGKVKLTRYNKSTELKNNTCLFRNDQLDISGNDNVTIICKKDNKEINVFKNQSFREKCGDLTRLDQRGNLDQYIIITPVNNGTAILFNSQLNIRFRKVKDATNYKIEIKDDDEKVVTSLSTTKNDITLDYEFKPGNTYSLIIKATKTNILITEENTSFSMLTESDSQDKKQKLKKQESLIETSPDPNFERIKLGDMYLEIGNINEAENNYKKAEENAQKTNDLEAEKLAKERLQLLQENQ